MISEYRIVKEGSKVNIYFKNDDKALFTTLSPPMTVKRVYLNGEGTLGKFRWTQEKKDAKYEIEVVPETGKALSWVESMGMLREEVLDMLWRTSFEEAKSHFPDGETMPLVLRKKAIPLVHPTYGTIKARRGLWGEVPIMDMALKQVNKFDNETAHVKVGDSVRLQLGVKPYCIQEKTFGMALQLDGVIVASSGRSTVTYCGELDYTSCCP